MGSPLRAQRPTFTHGDWVQVYVDPDPTGRGPGFIRIEERQGAPGVAVLPLLGNSVGLVSVYRRTLDKQVLEIPRGFGGEGTGPRSDATRELEEETGILIPEDALIDLGSITPNSGILSASVCLYAAVVGDDQRQTTIQDNNEVSSFEWRSIGEVMDLIRGDGLQDSFTQAALLRAAAVGLISLGAPSRDTHPMTVPIEDRA